MAYPKSKPAPKPEAEPAPNKGANPDFNVRARARPVKDGEDPKDVPYITIGAAWAVEVGGKACFSLKLNNPPLNWDGSALMMPWLAPKK